MQTISLGVDRQLRYYFGENKQKLSFVILSSQPAEKGRNPDTVPLVCGILFPKMT